MLKFCFQLLSDLLFKLELKMIFCFLKFFYSYSVY